MLTPHLLLIVIGSAFLVADALGKLPSWTWGLCLFLMFLVLLIGK